MFISRERSACGFRQAHPGESGQRRACRCVMMQGAQCPAELEAHVSSWGRAWGALFGSLLVLTPSFPC